MLTEPMDILKLFPVRKTKTQKEAFRSAVQSYVTELGYLCAIENGLMGARNVVIGDPEQAKFLVTAHYDTPAGMPFPNLITPCNAVTVILYQLFVMALYFAVSAGVGFGVYWLTKDAMIGFWAGYLLCFTLLILTLVGPANRNNANDNTSGVVTVLETVRSMPENLRNSVCFVLFDLEEVGLVGSSSYRRAHKVVTENQIILNLDCVGDGDEILLFPNKKLKKDPEKMALLKAACGQFGKKSIALRDNGFFYYPSDQKNFPYGAGIAAFRRSKLAGLYCGRIHTNRDTILEKTNVNILRAALTTVIGTAAK